jgi:DNA-binding response OmpR family regulator
MEQMAHKTPPIHVLLVEDEFFISAWVEQSLSEQGFAVYTAANASDALQHLASTSVDVLLTDVNLGCGMDGAALARRARELQPDLTVVYASATMPALRVPGSVFVSKPYEPEFVGQVLMNTLQAGECRASA